MCYNESKKVLSGCIMYKRICAIAFVLCAAAALSVGAVFASAAPADLLLTPAGASYYFIEEPVSLFADDSNLYVGGSNALYRFGRGGKFVDKTDGGADGYAVSGERKFRLQNGVLYYNEAQAAENVAGFAFDGNILYLYRTRQAGLYAYDVVDDGIDNERAVLPDTVCGVAAAAGRLYVGIKRGSTASVCEAADGSLTELDGYLRGLTKLTADGDVLCALVGGDIVRYENGERIATAASDVLDIAYADGLFALTYDGAVVRYADDLSGRTELTVSASAATGYFNSPQAAATRKDTVAVADTGNDRVALVGAETQYLQYAFSRPIAAGMDDRGNIYVAHKTNHIEIFSRAGAHLDTIRCDGQRIRDLKIDSLDDVVLRTDDGIYKLNGHALETLYTGRTQAVACQPDGSGLYVLQDGRVSRLADGALTETFAVAEGASDLAVDLQKTVYAVAGNTLYRYASPFGSYIRQLDVPELSGGSVRITLSSIDTALLDYGDIILTDTAASAVRRIAGSALGVVMLDETDPPIDVNDKTPAEGGEGVLYRATEAIDLYEYPRDMSPQYVLQAGAYLLIVAPLPDSAYSYAVAEYADKLVSGYVRKSRLQSAENLPYSDPIRNEAKIQNANSKIYKYPSLYAPVLTGYDNVAKDTSISLLRFADAYRDCRNGRWYRVAVDGGEGYIPATGLTINHYQPIFVRPQYNATIIEANGKAYADLFVGDGTPTLLDGETLPAGTRVEVVGAFDPSKEYTRIKYFNEDLGTLECSVLTVHLKYKGVSALQVVAAVLIILTVIAAIILFVWRYRVRKRREFAPESETTPKEE